MEIWKNIPGIDKFYFVSNLGNFKSIGKTEIGSRRSIKRKDRFLKPTVESNGYNQIGFVVNGKQRRYLCHRIVALVFIPIVKGSDFVNHKNGIKTDNRIENLEWCTKSENAIHSFKIGLQSNVGSKHPNHILNEKTVIKIRKNKKLSEMELALTYGVAKRTIKDVLEFKTWKHV